MNKKVGVVLLSVVPLTTTPYTLFVLNEVTLLPGGVPPILKSLSTSWDRRCDCDCKKRGEDKEGEVG